MGTGSTSIHRYLRLHVPDSDFGPDHPNYGPKKGHWHGRLCQIVNYFEIPVEELPTYRIATFYRDPIERVLTVLPYQIDHFPHRNLDTVSLSEWIEIQGQYMHPQWMYLTDRNIIGERVYDGIDLNWEWFNYHDYENEFRRLASWFGLTPGNKAPKMVATTGNQIPHLNHYENTPTIADLTQQDIDRIKEIFRADYELLEQHGIMVPSRDL